MSTTNVVEGSSKVLECVGFGRRSLDLIVDSLEWHCYKVQGVLDYLEAQGLAKPMGSYMQGSLTYEMTEPGRERFLSNLDQKEKLLWELGLAPDDVSLMEDISEEAFGDAATLQRKWEVGATKLHLWEAGLVTLTGFIRSSIELTPKGSAVLRSVKQTWDQQ